MAEADPERVSASLVRLGVVLGVAVAVVQAVAHLVDVFVYDSELEALSADVDGNAFAWASSMATLACGFVAFVFAYFDQARSRRHVVLGTLLVLFSIDDVIAVHERIGTIVRSDVLGLPSGFGRLVWPAVFFPLLAATLVLLLERKKSAPAAAASALTIGLGCLVAAVAGELASTAWYGSGGSGESWPGALEVVAEEGLEIVGWSVIAAALAGAAYAVLTRPPVPAAHG